jgi:pimeloyl-ACP methyl ester carboxylesterase
MAIQAGPIPKSVELSTGVTLQYVEQGDLGGLPVLFLHGATDSWHSFETLLPYLPPTWRSIAIAQRGHGDSSKPAHGYGPPDFVADIAAFQDALGIGPSVIVGHSFGSLIGQRFAVAFPERALALVLMATFRNLRGNPGVEEFLEQVITPLTDPIDPAIAREFQESTLARPIPDAYLETVVAESLKAPARVWRELFTTVVATDFERGLDTLTAPTLILWGDQDVYSSRDDQEFITQTIPGAQLIVYPGYGHAFHWEDPAMVAADLIAFVEDDRC